MIIRYSKNTDSSVLVLSFKDIKHTFTSVLALKINDNFLDIAIVEMTNNKWSEIFVPGVVELNCLCSVQEDNTLVTAFNYLKRLGESSELVVRQDLLGERTTELNKW